MSDVEKLIEIISIYDHLYVRTAVVAEQTNNDNVRFYLDAMLDYMRGVKRELNQAYQAAKQEE